MEVEGALMLAARAPPHKLEIARWTVRYFLHRARLNKGL
jgi:hypothetical protein